MSMRRVTLLAVLLLMRAWPCAAQDGRISGLVQKDGAGLAGVTVLVNETRAATLTDRAGHFVLDAPPGVWTLTISIGEHLLTREDVRVALDGAADLTIEVPWDIGFVDTTTVESASRRPERIIDAPAAVTVVSRDTLSLGAAAGQLPRLVRNGTGVEAPQSSLYDFNVNTRGVNGFLTRRIQTIIDGRDPSNPATSATEWWNLDLLADEIASVELARGPSAALYGPNSFNGVLNIVTLTPRESQGGTARVTAGSRDTMKLHGRWAGDIGSGWYLKLLGQRTSSEDFTTSRDRSVEYAGLERELVPLTPERLEFTAGSVRVDHDTQDGRALALEAGVADGSGAVFMTPASRGQQRDTSWTWARANYHTASWNVASSFNRRSGQSALLSSGAALFDDGRAFAIDGQAHQQRLSGKLRLVGGASYTHRLIDSADDQGVQTLFVRAVTSHQGALFGQADYDVSGRVKLVAAARYDSSNLHDAQFSPKLSLVFAPAPAHRLRAGYNRAFQVATYTDLFVNVAAAPPLNLSAIETPLAPLLGGGSLGFSSVPIRVLGNDKLAVERVNAFDAGYSGVIGSRTLIGADYFYNRMHDFISGFLPGVNPALGPYRLPAAIPRAIAQAFESAVNAAIPGLTTDAAGRPMIALSNTNFGSATAQGVDLSAGYYVGTRWRLDANYTWFRFHANEAIPVAPNAPSHSVKMGATFARGGALAGLGARWVDAFTWSSGVFSGPVPSYIAVDLSGRYDLGRHWQVGASVDNVMNNVHYEMFGGNLLPRFALGYAAVKF